LEEELHKRGFSSKVIRLPAAVDSFYSSRSIAAEIVKRKKEELRD